MPPAPTPEEKTGSWAKTAGQPLRSDMLYKIYCEHDTQGVSIEGLMAVAQAAIQFHHQHATAETGTFDEFGRWRSKYKGNLNSPLTVMADTWEAGFLAGQRSTAKGEGVAREELLERYDAGVLHAQKVIAEQERDEWKARAEKAEKTCQAILMEIAALKHTCGRPLNAGMECAACKLIPLLREPIGSDYISPEQASDLRKLHDGAVTRADTATTALKLSEERVKQLECDKARLEGIHEAQAKAIEGKVAATKQNAACQALAEGAAFESLSPDVTGSPAVRSVDTLRAANAELERKLSEIKSIAEGRKA